MKKIIDFLEENGGVDDSSRKIVEYGLKRLWGWTGDFALVIAVSGILHIVWAGVLFQVSYMLLRVHAGGYHAASQKKCRYISLLCTLSCLGLVRYAGISSGILLLISIVSFAGICRDAPVESVNKPLSEMEKAVFGRRAKIIAAAELVCCCGFYYFESAYFLRAVSVAMAVVYAGVAVVVIPERYRRRKEKKSVSFFPFENVEMCQKIPECAEGRMENSVREKAGERIATDNEKSDDGSHRCDAFYDSLPAGARGGNRKP